MRRRWARSDDYYVRRRIWYRPPWRTSFPYWLWFQWWEGGDEFRRHTRVIGAPLLGALIVVTGSCDPSCEDWEPDTRQGRTWPTWRRP